MFGLFKKKKKKAAKEETEVRKNGSPPEAGEETQAIMLKHEEADESLQEVKDRVYNRTEKVVLKAKEIDTQQRKAMEEKAKAEAEVDPKADTRVFKALDEGEKEGEATS